MVQSMRIKLDQDSPLALLNQVLPNGVPVKGDEPNLFLSQLGLPCWEVDLSQLSLALNLQIADIATGDRIPISIGHTMSYHGRLLIPVNHVEGWNLTTQQVLEVAR